MGPRLIVQPQSKQLSGRVRVPGDKSVGHRALLFSLLAGAPIRITGLGDGADNGRSAKAITALGAQVAREGATIVVRGPGIDRFSAPTAPIDCGNSGTTIRLLTGLLAGQRFATTLIGDESLSLRPMRRVIEPLTQMGAVIVGQGRGAGGGGAVGSAAAGAVDVTPPLRVGPAGGRLRPIDYAMPMASAQVKTAILLAGLYADGVTSVTEPGPSRDHTERMLRFLQAPISVDGHRVSIDTRGWNRQLAGGDIEVPGDPSSSAFLLAAALIAGGRDVRIDNVMVNPTRTGFLDVLAAMGATVTQADVRETGRSEEHTV